VILRGRRSKILIVFDGQPLTGVASPPVSPSWAGGPNRARKMTGDGRAANGVWIEGIGRAELARPGVYRPLPAGPEWALDMGRSTRPASRRDLSSSDSRRRTTEGSSDDADRAAP